MTLVEAIEKTEKVLLLFGHRLEETEKEALKLDIEAGKRIITSRHSKHHNYKRLLPGETA